MSEGEEPETGPHEVHGAIRDQWANMGWENCYLRYPTSDERGEGDGRYSQFQGGYIRWSPEKGATAQRATRYDDS